MTTEHTAGPWLAQPWDYSNPDRVKTMIVGEQDAVAEVLDLWCMDERTEERDANARLIAAAPDMLAALREVADFWSVPFPGRYPWLDQVRTAIAKATETKTASNRPGDMAADMAEETGIEYSRCLVMCNMD